jgi:hypothetical protein
MNNQIDKVRNACSAGVPVPAIRQDRTPGRHLFHNNDIPAEIRNYVGAKIGAKAAIYTARINASYKGPVLLNGADWLVQAVGKNKTAVVVHRKVDVTLIGTIALRDNSKRLVGTYIQVHYDAGRAKAYSLGVQKVASNHRSQSVAKPSIEVER